MSHAAAVAARSYGIGGVGRVLGGVVRGEVRGLGEAADDTVGLVHHMAFFRSLAGLHLAARRLRRCGAA
nr:hypothetical protein OG690_27770 [Streptomyces tubercidicus]